MRTWYIDWLLYCHSILLLVCFTLVLKKKGAKQVIQHHGQRLSMHGSNRQQQPQQGKTALIWMMNGSGWKQRPDATCRWMDTLKQLLELIRFPLTSCHLLWHHPDQNWRIRIWNRVCAPWKSGHKSTSGPRTATPGRRILNGQCSRFGGTGLISVAPGEVRRLNFEIWLLLLITSDCFWVDLVSFSWDTLNLLFQTPVNYCIVIPSH